MSSGEGITPVADPLSRYRPVRRLGTAVTVALSVYLAAVLVSIAADTIDWQVTTDILTGRHIPEEQIQRIDWWLDVTDRAFLVVYFGTAVVFLTTLYRLAANARALTRNGIAAPAGAVVWFFVPGLNLFMPYLTVQQIWKASGPGGRPWRKNPPSVLVKRWWAFWLLSFVLGTTVGRLNATVETMASYRSALGLSLVVGVINFALGVTALLLVRRLAVMQEERYSYLRANSSETCPKCGELLGGTETDCPVCGKPFTRAS